LGRDGGDLPFYNAQKEHDSQHDNNKDTTVMKNNKNINTIGGMEWPSALPQQTKTAILKRVKQKLPIHPS
jgi:hypothetical protein